MDKVGVAQANEVLLWGKKKTATELRACGFVKYVFAQHTSKGSPDAVVHSEIFPDQPAEQFHATVRKHIEAELAGLDPTALLTIKGLLRRGLAEKNDPDAVNLRESYAQAGRLASGTPVVRFGQIARKEIKHKL